ncbi:DUF2156 domain-containing protein [Sphingomonas crocodyli]|uniref:DUF2156 domain-containing protein n=2 Tax=Sphingomonas crocodyli TaxID=1979270 RepID=A0A437MA27_9SPHN|nr:DUF2156 domain-containing protein [Sphingomonas crocodyli]
MDAGRYGQRRLPVRSDGASGTLMDGEAVPGGGLGMPLSLDMRERIEALIAPLRSPLSEYGFANLWLFRDRHDYRFVDGDLPHITGRTYDGERHAMPLVSIDAEGAARLLDGVDCLYPLSDDALAQAGFDVRWNDDDADYVYRAEALAKLDGAKAKRAQARAFEAEQAPVAEPLSDANLVSARTVLDGWLADVGRDPDMTDLDACREALARREALGLDGLLVTTGAGEPAAFLLAGTNADGSRVVHFAKGRRVHAGAYPWMFARFAATCGAAIVNFEQDLGKPGFAQAKRALAPMGQLRKYRASKRGGA